MEPDPGRPPDPAAVQALRHAVEDALADFGLRVDPGSGAGGTPFARTAGSRNQSGAGPP